MSKTFKTHPSWVKIRQKPQLGTEYHDHSHKNADGINVCDMDDRPYDWPFYWQAATKFNCGYNLSYYSWNGGFYSRPRRGQVYRHKYEGRSRANWRKDRDNLLKLSFEDIEDYDVLISQHRHSAKWEIW